MTNAKAGAIQPEEGAKTPIFLASDESLVNVTGKYYHEGVEDQSSDLSYDADLQDFFFNKSVELTKCSTDILEPIST